MTYLNDDAPEGAPSLIDYQAETSRWWYRSIEIATQSGRKWHGLTVRKS